MWRCSFGVVNCPICMRPREDAIAAKKRIKEVRERVERALLARAAKVKVSRITGKVSFEGIATGDDEAIYRAIMVSGSALARAEIAKAEQLAGRSVNVQAGGSARP